MKSPEMTAVLMSTNVLGSEWHVVNFYVYCGIGEAWKSKKNNAFRYAICKSLYEYLCAGTLGTLGTLFIRTNYTGNNLYQIKLSIAY